MRSPRRPAARSTRPAATARGYRLRLVAHDPADFRRFYNEFANPALWFSSTTWPSSSSAPSEEAWDSYRRVNANVAEAVLEELEEEPDTPVWFHDYHLYLAPAVVRAARPRCDALALRPHPLAAAGGVEPAARAIGARALHEGLLANDVVGFHTQRWREHFLDSVAAIARRRRPAPRHRAPDLRRHREFDELARS